MYNWAKLPAKAKSGNTSKQSTPLHLSKTILHAVTKVSLYRSPYPPKPRGLLLSPTGIATININGNTIYSGLHIPCLGKLIDR